jgi:hypothetical protein
MNATGPETGPAIGPPVLWNDGITSTVFIFPHYSGIPAFERNSKPGGNAPARPGFPRERTYFFKGVLPCPSMNTDAPNATINSSTLFSGATVMSHALNAMAKRWSGSCLAAASRAVEISPPHPAGQAVQGARAAVAAPAIEKRLGGSAVDSSGRR